MSQQVPARIDETLAALADPNRRIAIELLGEKPRRSGELAELAGLSAPAMSRHLRVLRNAGLVEESFLHEDARVRIYALRREPMLELRLWLESTAAMWTEALEAFRSHVEGEGDA